VRNVRFIVANNVKALREANGQTQEEVAHLADVDVSYLSRLERGIANPSIELLDKLAGVLKTTPAALLTEGATD